MPLQLLNLDFLSLLLMMFVFRYLHEKSKREYQKR